MQTPFPHKPVRHMNSGSNQMLTRAHRVKLSALNTCVRCGTSRLPTDPACHACTWPFSEKAWDQTSFRINRITLDTCCLNSKRKDVDLNKLEAWAGHGYFELQRTTEMLEDVRRSSANEPFFDKALAIDEVPGVFTPDATHLGGGDVLAGPDLKNEIRKILFPHPQLTQQQISDIEHLYEHIRTGGDIFATSDLKGFIKNGKEENLLQRGVWVFSPDKLVPFLSRLYNWQ